MLYKIIEKIFFYLHIIVCIFMVALILLNITLKNTSNQDFFYIFWIYFIIISIILNSEIFLMQRLYESFKKFNSKYKIPFFQDGIKCNFILITAPVIIISLIIVINLFIVIYKYIFDYKIKFHIYIKNLSFIFVCTTVALSFFLLVLFILYMFFIDKVLSKSTKNLSCIYPISFPLFGEVKKIFTNVNFIYWEIIILYMVLIFFHMSVYSGYFSSHNTDLFENISQNFSYIWMLLLIVILIGYFVIFYFPNKILYNYVLNVKLQTISKTGKNIRNNPNPKSIFDKIEFIYNSPDSFKNFFLSKVITVLSTVITIAISILQLLQ